MPLRRFIIFWTLDYLTAMLVVFVISTAGPAIFGWTALRYFSLFYVPVGSMFFSWLAYRGVERQVAHRLIVALAWMGLALTVDLLVSVTVTHVNPLVFLFSPLLVAVYGLKFLSVFAGAYLGLSPEAKGVEDERLSLRSASALRRSSDLLHPGQE